MKIKTFKFFGVRINQNSLKSRLKDHVLLKLVKLTTRQFFVIRVIYGFGLAFFTVALSVDSFKWESVFSFD